MKPLDRAKGVIWAVWGVLAFSAAMYRYDNRAAEYFWLDVFLSAVTISWLYWTYTIISPRKDDTDANAEKDVVE